METEKIEPTPVREIHFVFNENGIQQEVLATTNADLLTAAAILVVQVERYTPNKTLDDVVKDFVELFVKKANEHIEQLQDKEHEESIEDNESFIESLSQVEEAGDPSEDETRL